MSRKNLMKESGIQINGGIMINVDVNIKSTIYVKKIIFENLDDYDKKYMKPNLIRMRRITSK